ncbi:Hypothetical_protein [Hexamita inflata]|uniref:Hypothetical_protein n=1 Tax=Hexamita inflata TaxID=28002 RepID=A0AA86UIB6_9EUKA|nr:Hypothetical protein HINF_LOCUS28833 [Hexamita inflata]
MPLINIQTWRTCEPKTHRTILVLSPSKQYSSFVINALTRTFSAPPPVFGHQFSEVLLRIGEKLITIQFIDLFGFKVEEMKRIICESVDLIITVNMSEEEDVCVQKTVIRVQIIDGEEINGKFNLCRNLSNVKGLKNKIIESLT